GGAGTGMRWLWLPHAGFFAMLSLHRCRWLASRPEAGGEFMLPEYLTVQRRARGAFDSLSSHERDSIFAKFRALSEIPSERWPEYGARRTNDDHWPYLLRATESLLVFFSYDGAMFVIEDLVRQ